MASVEMEQFLVVLVGFSKRLEVQRVEIKRQLVEEVDRRIDCLQEKVKSLDDYCRGRIPVIKRRIKTEDDAEMIPLVPKNFLEKRSKEPVRSQANESGEQIEPGPSSS